MKKTYGGADTEKGMIYQGKHANLIISGRRVTATSKANKNNFHTSKLSKIIELVRSHVHVDNKLKEAQESADNLGPIQQQGAWRQERTGP